MTEVLELLKAANGLSPLAIIGLLAVAIILMAKGRKEVNTRMDMLADNHLHEIPLLVENSNKTVETLQRIEVRLAEGFASLKDEK